MEVCVKSLSPVSPVPGPTSKSPLKRKLHRWSLKHECRQGKRGRWTKLYGSNYSLYSSFLRSLRPDSYYRVNRMEDDPDLSEFDS